jgi:hypothetical protein
MPTDPDDPHYTFNAMTNEDKELLLRNGYVPGELSPEEARELLTDLRADDDDEGASGLRGDITADERDDT